ncbi:MAG: ATP synthase F1 subunit gamma [Candidatus Gastranaerophilales bacterium]|nr:ATP synthase F1 subunit gamma [Candidatus Gastranaerophilales bacterium]
MANLRDIKTRIKSVKSTGKITQAMKMVAASKVKKTEKSAKESRPYALSLIKVFSEVLNSRPDIETNKKFKNAIENYPKLLTKRDIKTVGLFVITSDKGLAGAYNTNIVKRTTETVDKLQKEGLGVKLFVVGLKGISALKKIYFNTEVEIVKKYSKIPPIVTIEIANMVAEDLATAFVNEQIDKIEVITTKFKTMLSYSVESFDLLPVNPPDNKEVKLNGEMIFEPSEGAVLQKIVPLYLSNIVFTSLREAMASELASRMNAMSNATKNAEEMARSLSIEYNKARQYSITQDILEVVSGANAIE